MLNHSIYIAFNGLGRSDFCNNICFESRVIIYIVKNFLRCFNINSFSVVTRISENKFGTFGKATYHHLGSILSSQVDIVIVGTLIQIGRNRCFCMRSFDKAITNNTVVYSTSQNRTVVDIACRIHFNRCSHSRYRFKDISTKPGHSHSNCRN